MNTMQTTIVTNVLATAKNMFVKDAMRAILNNKTDAFVTMNVLAHSYAVGVRNRTLSMQDNIALTNGFKQLLKELRHYSNLATKHLNVFKEVRKLTLAIDLVLKSLYL